MSNTDILLVIEGTYPWYRGGVSEWVHQYIQNCPNQNFHILQVATDQYLNAQVSEALYQIPEHVHSFCRIPPPDLRKDWQVESYRWKNRLREKTSRLVNQCDFVHIANTGFAGWLGKEWAEDTNKPLLLTEHALYWKEVDMGAVALECGYKIPDNRGKKEQYVQMFKSMARDIYLAADITVSVSECNITEQQNMGADDVMYIPNGIPASWLKEHKSHQDPLTIGWVGRCAEMKNPMKFFELVDAARQMEIADIQFLMLCCDANEPELAGGVKKKSKQYSELELIWNQSTENYIDEMDALCITSHNESQPLVLFEALARRVLPIGWQAGDVTEKYALIINKGVDSNKLLRKTLELWYRPYKWERYIREKSLLLAEQHTWENIFKRYRGVFDLLLKESPLYNG
ncbi:glycosyltransferase [Fodinibius halophilus]|uniref:DUF3492 domain-containing protein n=1 Tax=Fodinibius halophilus TaxID=1736908 RepID=A0A6M1TGX4_9BACT|nr:DUF3492 domain-containing protein [Fodinibius halophilus]NGP87900.1 DUF3492 domain-containing protein [Fodinibius halophilus]